MSYVEPIRAMPPGLHEVKLACYVLMRGIDEIEDHPGITAIDKARVLDGISQLIQSRLDERALSALLAPCAAVLPTMSLRLHDWASLLPASIGPRVLDTFATMAERMADWVRRGFRVETESDLDRYTFSVAGSLALMLGDVWSWFDGTSCDRTLLLGYGRGIQAANILSDKAIDAHRDVSFWPAHWDPARMVGYARRELLLADRLLDSLRADSPVHRWCRSPIAVAWRSLT
ncbi:squalene/phytoene synthase family protein [Nocardia brasiliensis]|uniref:squalene/phytoene synthase family protein n=1 Tax=Nocardia brasiliensis TaxID=37326 RepID=UPI0037886DC5